MSVAYAVNTVLKIVDRKIGIIEQSKGSKKK